MRTSARRHVDRGLMAAGIVAGALAWELVGRAIDQPTQFATLSQTIMRGFEITVDGTLPRALGTSLVLYVTGLITATAAGYSAGIALARIDWLRTALEDYITALYATPLVALIPFLLAVLGFGFFPKSIIVFLFAFFPVFLNTIEGARSISPALMEVARSFHCHGRSLWVNVILPYTLPYAMTGVRQAMAVGLVGVVAAEFFLSSTGLGQIIIASTQRFDSAAILACSLVLALFGVMVMACGRAIENRFAAWKV
jgi:ABC-type nitrate/sulfonate/bicarbonate transport system permease component